MTVDRISPSADFPVFFLFLFFSDSLYDHLLDFVDHLSLLLPVSCISLPPLFLLFNVSSLIFTVFFPASSASLFDHLYLPPRPLNSTDTYPRPSLTPSISPTLQCRSVSHSLNRSQSHSIHPAFFFSTSNSTVMP